MFPSLNLHVYNLKFPWCDPNRYYLLLFFFYLYIWDLVQTQPYATAGQAAVKVPVYDAESSVDLFRHLLFIVRSKMLCLFLYGSSILKS